MATVDVTGFGVVFGVFGSPQFVLRSVRDMSKRCMEYSTKARGMIGEFQLFMEI